MKILLILLIAILSIQFGNSQSVPNTTTFSLQDVINAVSPTTPDLQDCFNDAVGSYFDPAYNNDSYAPANSLLRFRNYKPSCTGAPYVSSLSYPGYPGSQTSTSIIVSTTVSVPAGCTLTARRIHYSTTNSPPLSTDPYFTQANTSGIIQSTVTGLSPNTGYYFACYAYTTAGSDYAAPGFKVYTKP